MNDASVIQGLTKLTRRRKDALEQLLSDTSITGALLLLIEQLEDGIIVAPSYAAGALESLGQELFERVIFIPKKWLEDNDLRNLNQPILEKIEAEGWESLGGNALQGTLLWEPTLQYQNLAARALATGVLIIESRPEVEPEKLQAIGQRLSAILTSSRDERFKDAILRMHQDILARASGVEKQGKRLFQVIKDEISAQAYVEEVVTPHSLPLRHSATSGRWLFERADPRLGEDHALEIRTIDLKENTLSVPVHEISYTLESTKFLSKEAHLAKLKKARCISKVLTFGTKRTSGYLQTYFSDSDRQIASTICDIIQGFVDAEERERALSASGRDTDLADPKDHDLIELYRDLNELQPVAGLAEIEIDIFGHEIEISLRNEFGRENIHDSYVERLRKYAEAFYLKSKKDDLGKLLIGLDVENSHSFLEFHLPSDSGHARLLVVHLKGEVIPCTLYQAIIDKMESFYIRQKQDEVLLSQANYLIETRHSIIHYFSLARDALEELKYDWDQGLRNPAHWAQLRQQVDFPELLDNASWSINHANMILENGRFQVRDIDSQSINKKNVDLEDIIKSCMRVLQFQRKKKGIIWHHRIEGRRPSHVYGDAILLHIAMLNLFDNAVKYAPNDTKIRWVLSYFKDHYRFSITNQGDHIDPRRLPLLLQIGYRGRQRDQLNARPGTGMGLPVTNKILIAHAPNAGLKLDSDLMNPNFGGAANTFFFDMPYLTGVDRHSERHEG